MVVNQQIFWIECYAIGGFVRDLIIGKKSAKDIDILVVGNGIEIAKQTAKKLKIKVPIVVRMEGTNMQEGRNCNVLII